MSDATREDSIASSRAWILASRLAAVIVFAIGFLPLADWIPGGDEVGTYGLLLDEWASGLTIVLGAGLVLFLLLRGARWPAIVLARARRVAERVRWNIPLPVVALVLYLWIALSVFNGHPLLIDEIVQVMHAQILATGHLSTPTPPHAEFFSALHLVDWRGRTFSQFPVGGPAMLALGVLLHATWIIGPIAGAISVALWRAIVRREPSRAALWSVPIFAFAPFAAFMAGSHMNHVTSLAWILLGLLGTVRVRSDAAASKAWSFAAGLGFGIAGTIRPVDAACFAVPAGLWLLADAWRRRGKIAPLLLAAFGVAAPLALLMIANWRTTGHPLLFGYELLWGKNHNLGFHRAPWGLVHTPARGVEQLNLYFVALQRYLLEAPVPALLPVVLALAFVRRLTSLERYLLASSALLVTAYWAYWHFGFFLGPRFMYPLLPGFALATARAMAAARWPASRFSESSRAQLRRYTVACAFVAGVVTVGYSMPLRVRQYRKSFPTERWNVEAALRAAGAMDGLVLVRESWESQMVVRLWALGISHTDGELFYRSIDACRLEQSISALERENASPTVARERIWRLLPDSTRIVTRHLTTGNVRMDTTGTWTPLCARRYHETELGDSPLAPTQIVHAGNTIFARDLHARDTLLLREYPTKTLWLLRSENASPDARPALYRIDLDSLRNAWAADINEQAVTQP